MATGNPIKFGKPVKWGWTTDSFPWGEVVLLPLAAMLAVAGLICGVLRGIGLGVDLPYGVFTFVGVAIAAGLGAGATGIGAFFGMSAFLRSVDMVLSMAIGAFLVTLDCPPGPIRTLSLNVAIPGFLLSWGLASYTAGIIWRIMPPDIPKFIDSVLAERLNTEHFMRKVYSKRDVEMVGELTRRRVIDAIVILVVFITAVNIFRPVAEKLRSDPLFAFFLVTFIAGILTFYGFVRLAAARRTAEGNTEQYLLHHYSAAWGLGVGIPATFALGFGFFLPANISPLIATNWHKAMTNFTEWWIYLLWSKVKDKNLATDYANRQSIAMTGQPGADGFILGNGTGSLDPLGHLWGAIAILSLPVVLIYVILVIRRHYLGIVVDEDQGRLENWRESMLAILLWPWRSLVSWWRRRKERSAEEESERGGLFRRFGARRSQRRRRWVYPTDPVLFVRFIYRRLLVSAENAGISRKPWETPHEFADILAQVHPDSETAVEDITNTYCETRYASRIPKESIRLQLMQRLRQAARYLRKRNR